MINLWDMPGIDTTQHKRATYVTDKGLCWFNVVILVINERITESDEIIIEECHDKLVQYIIVRSKVDLEYLN